MTKKKKPVRQIKQYCFVCKEFFTMTPDDFRKQGHVDRHLAATVGVSVTRLQRTLPVVKAFARFRRPAPVSK